MRELPSDCALLITAPVTKGDFLADLENPQKDFAKSWAKKQIAYHEFEKGIKLTPENLWEIYSLHVGNFVLKIAGEIEELGAEVFFNAKLDILPEIFTGKKVVTVEAHWFSPALEIADFYNLSSFAEQLNLSNTLVAKTLRKVISSENIGSQRLIKSNDNCVPGIIDELNTLFSRYNSIETKPAPIFITSDDGETQEEVWIHFNRFALEQSFLQEVRERCGIEMFDMIHSIKEFDETVPLDFDGVLDLTVCTSEHVGTFLKKSRVCQILTNRYPTDLKVRLIIYKGVMKLLSKGICESYRDASFRLRQQLIKQDGE